MKISEQCPIKAGKDFSGSQSVQLSNETPAMLNFTPIGFAEKNVHAPCVLIDLIEEINSNSQLKNKERVCNNCTRMIRLNIQK